MLTPSIRLHKYLAGYMNFKQEETQLQSAVNGMEGNDLYYFLKRQRVYQKIVLLLKVTLSNKESIFVLLCFQYYTIYPGH